MWRPEVSSAVDQYQKTGALPRLPPVFWRVRDPESGVYLRRWLNAVVQGRVLRQMGFRCRIRPYYHRRPVLSKLEPLGLLTPLSLLFAANFHIVARKR